MVAGTRSMAAKDLGDGRDAAPSPRPGPPPPWFAFLRPFLRLRMTELMDTHFPGSSCPYRWGHFRCHPEPAKRGEGPPAGCEGVANRRGSFAVYAASKKLDV